MAKRQIRVAKAKDGLGRKIDLGAILDVEIKKLVALDKETKGKITEGTKKLLEKGELSIRVEGKSSAVLVSFRRKAVLDTTNTEFKKVVRAVDRNQLVGVVDKTVTVTINSEAVEKVRTLLGGGVFDSLVTVSAGFKVDAAGFEKFTATQNPRQKTLRRALERCVNIQRTASIKYEPKLVT